MSKDKMVWTTQEVEKYTQKIMSKSEADLLELREKVNILTVKNSKLTKDVRDLKAKERRMSKALTEATVKAKDSSKFSEMQSSISIVKFKGFVDKWTNYFNTIATYVGDSDLKNVKKEFEQDAETLIDEIAENGNFSVSGDEINFTKKRHIDLTNSDVFISGDNNSPLSKDDEKRFNKILKEVKSQMIHTQELNKESESGFSIEEALNPTDSLSDIVNDIMK